MPEGLLAWLAGVARIESLGLSRPSDATDFWPQLLRLPSYGQPEP